MSADLSSVGHRHTRRAATPSATASSRPSNPEMPMHHLNLDAYTRNTQTDIKPNQTMQPTTPPRTPRKDAQSTQYVPNSAAPETGSKQRSRHKNRPKNVMTSPAAGRNDRNTPPLNGAQSAGIPTSARPLNTPSTAAYAGSTFHASPAPSALPKPSFYSKSVPESPGIKDLRSLKAAPLTSAASTPPVAPSVDHLSREESPLDLFFKADREEKARARSASSTKAFAAPNGPFPPPPESPRHSQTPPSHSAQSRARDSHRLSANGIFAMEMDGERGPQTPYGPAFSTPYSERINAARSGRQTNGSFKQPAHHEHQPLDKTEALKAYLFSGQPTVSQPGHASSLAAAYDPSTNYQSPLSPGNFSNTTAHSRPHDGYLSGPAAQTLGNGLETGGRSSGLRQEVTPTKTPTKAPNHTNGYTKFPTSAFPSHPTTPGKSGLPGMAPNDSSTISDPRLQGMEDSLRKILKLDSFGHAGSNVGGPPAAAGSFPDYVRGNGPMNGGHNGFMGS